MHKLSMARDESRSTPAREYSSRKIRPESFLHLVQAIRGRPEWKKTNLPIHRMIDNFPDPAVFRAPASKIEVDPRNETTALNFEGPRTFRIYSIQ